MHATRAAQVLAPRATAHISSYAYADPRLVAARSVNLVAPPQRPRLDAALTCSDCHRYALHPRSPTDIPGVRIAVIRIRTTEQTVPVRSSTERGTRVRAVTVHVPIHVPVLIHSSTNFCTVADIDDIIDRSDVRCSRYPLQYKSSC